MSDTNYKDQESCQVRMWLIAACTAIAMMTSCTANTYYQERVFKEAAIAKGMDATQATCAWSGSTEDRCVILAPHGK